MPDKMDAWVYAKDQPNRKDAKYSTTCGWETAARKSHVLLSVPQGSAYEQSTNPEKHYFNIHQNTGVRIWIKIRQPILESNIKGKR